MTSLGKFDRFGLPGFDRLKQSVTKLFPCASAASVVLGGCLGGAMVILLCCVLPT